MVFHFHSSNFAATNHNRYHIMDDKQNTKKITKEDILALLARGREIKARRQREAEEWYAERQRRKKEAEESGYYDIEWV